MNPNSLNPDDPGNPYDMMETVDLTRNDYRARIAEDSRIVDSLMRHGDFRQWNDYKTNLLVREVAIAIYGKDHPQRHVIRFPQNWLEAVKERFAPAWVRKRWPVRFTEVTASLKELYPDIRPALPDRSPVWKFHVLSQTNVTTTTKKTP